MLTRLNKLKNWQVALIIAILGLAVFFTGLANPFQGDDIPQIVNNVPVHSIANFRLFFKGGTFYNGGGLVPLGGAYFRPLITVVFSIIYTLFGPHPIYFHLVQLALCIGSAVILFLFLKYSFKPVIALVLALIFLVHPINSQVAYAIPSMGDALFFFFGILALWLLLRFKSIRSLFLVIVCLFLSMLSKEAGMLFVVMSLIYLFWWDRKRFYPFMAILALPATIYVILRVNAIGWLPRSTIAPIDRLSLTGRLLTSPSVFLLYMTKFIFPAKLATSYYWVNSTFNVRHFLLPLIVDLAIIALVTYVALAIRKKASRAMYFTYLFIAVWVLWV
jgi:hypothetical protein